MSQKNNSTHIYEDFESYDEVPASEKYSKPTVFGIIVRVVFYALILLVNCALVFRVCMADDPKSVSSPKINDVLREAYSADSKNFSIKTQTIYDMYTEDGLFYSTGMFLCESAEQLQVTLRYNYRTMPDVLICDDLGFGFDTMEKLSDEEREKSEYSSVSASDVKNGEFFAYRLKDDDGNVYELSEKTKITRFLYVYQTLTFDGVLEGSSLYLEIYMIRDGVVDYSVPVGSMKVYSKDRELLDYKLSNSEIKELGK